MKVKTNLIRVFILLAVLLLPVAAVHAQSPGGDVVLFGQNYLLKSGDVLNGSLAVFGGNITIESEASANGDIALFGGNFKQSGSVTGNVAVIGGNLTISGKVDGDIVVIGGQATLSSTAVVNGNIATVGGQLQKDPKAQVSGNITNNTPPVQSPVTPNVPQVPSFNFHVNPLWSVFVVFGKAILLGAFAALLTLFLESYIRTVGEFAVSQPIVAGSVGLLSLFIGLILILTIAPILILAVAGCFGVIALGREVGERFTKAFNRTWAAPLTNGFGTFALVLVGGGMSLIPCVGGLFNLVIALIAIGAVMMTRFGTRSATAQPPASIAAQAAS